MPDGWGSDVVDEVRAAFVRGDFDSALRDRYGARPINPAPVTVTIVDERGRATGGIIGRGASATRVIVLPADVVERVERFTVEKLNAGTLLRLLELALRAHAFRDATGVDPDSGDPEPAPNSMRGEWSVRPPVDERAP